MVSVLYKSYFQKLKFLRITEIFYQQHISADRNTIITKEETHNINFLEAVLKQFGDNWLYMEVDSAKKKTARLNPLF